MKIYEYLKMDTRKDSFCGAMSELNDLGKEGWMLRVPSSSGNYLGELFFFVREVSRTGSKEK